MFVGVLLGYHETENQVYPYSVGGVEIDTIACSYERAACLPESWYSGMRKSNTMTEPSAAEPFACAELVENQPLRQGLSRAGEKLTQHFESPFSAAQVRTHDHAPRHEQIGDAYRHEESAMFALRRLWSGWPPYLTDFRHEGAEMPW